ncbi:MAG: hotdog fold thioesterase [Bdellovibrionales bacterium]|nr:hotdog fold thioesterase [Bdellovibrionales bacterium]
MSIWFKDYSLDEVNARGRGTMVEHVGIEVIEIGPDFLLGTMPVDHRTKQPVGLLHGGASVVLAETLASTAGNLIVDRDHEYCVGLEINANHIRSVTAGHVLGRSTPVHVGKSTQVWETRITQNDKLVCVSRMTLAVLKRPQK